MNLLEIYQTKYKEDVIISTNGELFVVKYIHAGVDFEDKYLQMARRLVLDKEGKIISRGFDKFFGYKQLEESEHYSNNFKKEFTDVKTIKDVQEKRDGSLILVTYYNNKMLISTTGSLDNDYIGAAYKYFGKVKGFKDFLEENQDKTFAFEYTSPDNIIAVVYQNTEYTFLNTIEKETGKLLGTKNYNKFNFNEPKHYILTKDELIKEQKEKENIEGYVAINEYDHLIKFKTDWWFKAHNDNSIFFGYSITKNKIEIIVKAIYDETIDDILAYRNQNLPNETNIITIYNTVQDIIGKAEEDYKVVIENNIERKDIARKFSDTCSYILDKIDNKDAEKIILSKTIQKLI